MNYENIPDGLALARLIDNFSVEKVTKLSIEFDHFEKGDVLYYADAYGDLEMAFVLQRFDKTLPEAVHKALYREYREAGWDVLEMRDTMDIEASECPICTTELYHFGGQVGSEFGTMNEYGDVIRIEHIGDEAGWHWYPQAEETDDRFMCEHCRDSFGYLEDNSNSVRLHLPKESDYNYGAEITGFTTCNGVIRFDDYYQENRSLWVPLCDVSNSLDMVEFAEAKATNRGQYRAHLDDNNWKAISYEELSQGTDPFTAETRFRNAFEEIVAEWQDSYYEIPTDIEYPYLMIDGKRLFTTADGYDQVYCEVSRELCQKGLDPVSPEEVKQ